MYISYTTFPVTRSGRDHVQGYNGHQDKCMSGQYRTILVIDDEETMHDSYTQILSRENYNILAAYEGNTGMRMVREKRPDIVLLDIKLPGRSGIDILQEITAIDNTIVTVVVTGYATIESAVEAMRYGAWDFLPKPFTPDELRLIVKRGLEKRMLLRETQRLQEENARMKENFVSIITHEMRSPLVAVEQYLQVLTNGIAGELQEKQEEILRKCDRRIKWILSLVDEWLSMARIQDERILEKLADIAVCDILDESMELVVSQAEKRGVTFESAIPTDLPTISANHDALLHLFMNLYSNAIKYNVDGGKVITGAVEDGDFVTVTISDTGVGIPEESLPFIFDEFFRVRRGPSPDGKKGETGTGLGLSIARKIVEAHKGYISAESCEGTGTCFTVRLPRRLLVE